MLMGSCFADNIGQRLVQAMFDADVNPFGISFNPLSIARQLDMLMCGTCLSEADLVYHQGMWHSMMHHSAFSSCDATRALESMNRRMALAAPPGKHRSAYGGRQMSVARGPLRDH